MKKEKYYDNLASWTTIKINGTEYTSDNRNLTKRKLAEGISTNSNDYYFQGNARYAYNQAEVDSLMRQNDRYSLKMKLISQFHRFGEIHLTTIPRDDKYFSWYDNDADVLYYVHGTKTDGTQGPVILIRTDIEGLTGKEIISRHIITTEHALVDGEVQEVKLYSNVLTEEPEFFVFNHKAYRDCTDIITEDELADDSDLYMEDIKADFDTREDEEPTPRHMVIAAPALAYDVLTFDDTDSTAKDTDLAEVLQAINDLTDKVVTLFASRARSIVTSNMDKETAHEYLDDEHGYADDLLSELKRYKARVTRFNL